MKQNEHCTHFFPFFSSSSLENNPLHESQIHFSHQIYYAWAFLRFDVPEDPTESEIMSNLPLDEDGVITGRVVCCFSVTSRAFGSTALALLGFLVTFPIGVLRILSAGDDDSVS